MSNLTTNSVSGASAYIKPANVNTVEKGSNEKVNDLFGNSNNGRLPQVKPGEKGSLEYFQKLLNLDNWAMQTGRVQYDLMGRVTSISISYINDCSYGCRQKHSGTEYRIQYGSDGSFTVTKTEQYHDTNFRNPEGEIESDVEVSKYDKDGKLKKRTHEVEYRTGKGIKIELPEQSELKPISYEG